MANTLFLYLEGPMQSWGERAHWSVRDSAQEPTKSGVIGLLACCLGLKEDADLRALSRQLRIGVRCDKPGQTLIDYHTVVGGVMSAQGKIKKNASTGEPETVVSWRHYLCDASFLAALQSKYPALIERLAQAVQSPYWPVYLGRKSCPPGRPPYAGIGEYPDLQTALEAFPLSPEQAQGEVRVRAVIECALGEGVRRRDETDANSRRTFLPRYTREILISARTQPEV
jgi:CRISPR system Cascade subunit CasD